MGRFFSMDNKFFTFMNKVADLCILNIICLVCCIPIVTAGASITAMYYVTLKMVRNEEAYIVRSFFKSFKDNFKQATIINLIMIAVGAVLYLESLSGQTHTAFHIVLTPIYRACDYVAEFGLVLFHIAAAEGVGLGEDVALLLA